MTTTTSLVMHVAAIDNSSWQLIVTLNLISCHSVEQNSNISQDGNVLSALYVWMKLMNKHNTISNSDYLTFLSDWLNDWSVLSELLSNVCQPMPHGGMPVTGLRNSIVVLFHYCQTDFSILSNQIYSEVIVVDLTLGQTDFNDKSTLSDKKLLSDLW